MLLVELQKYLEMNRILKYISILSIPIFILLIFFLALERENQAVDNIDHDMQHHADKHMQESVLSLESENQDSAFVYD